MSRPSGKLIRPGTRMMTNELILVIAIAVLILGTTLGVLWAIVRWVLSDGRARGALRAFDRGDDDQSAR